MLQKQKRHTHKKAPKIEPSTAPTIGPQYVTPLSLPDALMAAGAVVGDVGEEVSVEEDIPISARVTPAAFALRVASPIETAYDVS